MRNQPIRVPSPPHPPHPLPPSSPIQLHPTQLLTHPYPLPTQPAHAGAGWRAIWRTVQVQRTAEGLHKVWGRLGSLAERVAAAGPRAGRARRRDAQAAPRQAARGRGWRMAAAHGQRFKSKQLRRVKLPHPARRPVLPPSPPRVAAAAAVGGPPRAEPRTHTSMPFQEPHWCRHLPMGSRGSHVDLQPGVLPRRAAGVAGGGLRFQTVVVSAGLLQAGHRPQCTGFPAGCLAQAATRSDSHRGRTGSAPLARVSAAALHGCRCVAGPCQHAARQHMVVPCCSCRCCRLRCVPSCVRCFGRCREPQCPS